MKILLIALFFILNISAASNHELEANYKQLNQEIDKISKDLSAEEKVSLYFLVLSTHEKITTALALDETKIVSLQELEEETLKSIGKLYENNEHVDTKQIEKLKTLYKKMNQDGLELIKAKPKAGEKQIIYQDKIEIVEKTSYTYIIIASIISLIIGFLIALTMGKKTNNTNSTASSNAIKDLEDENTNLNNKLNHVNLKYTTLNEEIESKTLDVDKENKTLIEKNGKFPLPERE